ncbi:HTH-type transcriptional regulator UlaR [Caulifigura coniformis]|uniref:HTH-type transcriptional regulator UlaR n=2 Tax=Caulifigura coniformis TaxID=2527983 RepID=A0A517SHF3_9PLAN|nr:HTH-type transcriptional regulator UlaR [Caulifigura coniformis]
MAVLLDQRRDIILQLIESQGFASLQSLSEATGASESTLRRDLELLDRNGQIRRARGGAAYVGESLTPFEVRRERASAEKQRLGLRAADLIQPGETVLLDGGTTTLEVARNLAGKSLQVVTNSLPIVSILAGAPEIELIFLGGYLYPKTGVTLGPLTTAALERIKARRLVLSAGGMTPEGLFNSNSLLVDAERKMIEAADEIVVLADGTKFGHSELAFLCGWDAVDRIVVDGAPPPEWRNVFDDHGVAVELTTK